jgi:hypothetical protein
MGVLGEYIGRIYNEVRHRPQYIVQSAVNVQLRDARGPNSGPNLASSNPAILSSRAA